VDTYFKFEQPHMMMGKLLPAKYMCLWCSLQVTIRFSLKYLGRLKG